MRCVVAATDGSDTANRAIDFAAEFAGKFNTDLIVLCVISTAAPSVAVADLPRSTAAVRVLTRVENTTVSEVLTDMTSDTLTRAKRRAEERGAKRVSTELHAGEPAAIVLSVAEEQRADLIVVGKRGLGRLSGLVLGSTSQKLVLSAKCAVAVVP